MLYFFHKINPKIILHVLSLFLFFNSLDCLKASDADQSDTDQSDTDDSDTNTDDSNTDQSDTNKSTGQSSNNNSIAYDNSNVDDSDDDEEDVDSNPKPSKTPVKGIPASSDNTRKSSLPAKGIITSLSPPFQGVTVFGLAGGELIRLSQKYTFPDGTGNDQISKMGFIFGGGLNYTYLFKSRFGFGLEFNMGASPFKVDGELSSVTTKSRGNISYKGRYWFGGYVRLGYAINPSWAAFLKIGLARCAYNLNLDARYLQKDKTQRHIFFNGIGGFLDIDWKLNRVLILGLSAGLVYPTSKRVQFSFSDGVGTMRAAPMMLRIMLKIAFRLF